MIRITTFAECPLFTKAADVATDTIWTDRYITAFVADMGIFEKPVRIDAKETIKAFMALDPGDVQSLAEFQSRHGLITSPHRTYGINQPDENGAFENVDPRENVVIASNAAREELRDTWEYVAVIHWMLDVPEYIGIADPGAFLARRTVSLAEASHTTAHLQRLFRLSSGILLDGETEADAEAAEAALVRAANVAMRNTLEPYIIVDGDGCSRFAPLTTIMLRHMVNLRYKGRRMRKCPKCGMLFPEAEHGKISKYCSTYCARNYGNHPKVDGRRKDSILRSERRKAEKERKQSEAH